MVLPSIIMLIDRQIDLEMDHFLQLEHTMGKPSEAGAD
jgi:hypothetical protein